VNKYRAVSDVFCSLQEACMKFCKFLVQETWANFFYNFFDCRAYVTSISKMMCTLLKLVSELQQYAYALLLIGRERETGMSEIKFHVLSTLHLFV